MELEMNVQRLTDNSVDKEALLESMQSDKTALSRAIAQNKELKVQLAELQNGFVKMVSLRKLNVCSFVDTTQTDSVPKKSHIGLSHLYLHQDAGSRPLKLSDPWIEQQEIPESCLILDWFAFVQSNDNMEMMTNLTSEQHVSKELAARLSQQEEELKEMREQVSLQRHQSGNNSSPKDTCLLAFKACSFQLTEKEQHLRAYQESMNREEHKEHFTNEQLEDRLRHYEAQAQLVDTLQRELSSAQVRALRVSSSLCKTAATTHPACAPAHCTLRCRQVDFGLSKQKHSLIFNARFLTRNPCC